MIFKFGESDDRFPDRSFNVGKDHKTVSMEYLLGDIK